MFIILDMFGIEAMSFTMHVWWLCHCFCLLHVEGKWCMAHTSCRNSYLSYKITAAVSMDQYYYCSFCDQCKCPFLRLDNVISSFHLRCSIIRQYNAQVNIWQYGLYSTQEYLLSFNLFIISNYLLHSNVNRNKMGY